MLPPLLLVGAGHLLPGVELGGPERDDAGGDESLLQQTSESMGEHESSSEVGRQTGPPDSV